MSRYEFATNEYINDMTIVTLETAATETGTKDFIAVGTTIDRGEDLAVKGAVRLFSFVSLIYLRLRERFLYIFQTYIFEIVEVVPDQAVSQRRWYKLRLRCRDEAKGPVTAVCGLNDYLVSSMGQKVGDVSFRFVKCPRSLRSPLHSLLFVTLPVTFHFV